MRSGTETAASDDTSTLPEFLMQAAARHASAAPPLTHPVVTLGRYEPPRTKEQTMPASQEASQRVVGAPDPPGGTDEAVCPQRVDAGLQQPRAVALPLRERVDGELGHRAVLGRGAVRVVAGADRGEADHPVPPGIAGVDGHQHPQRRQRRTPDRGFP